MTGWISDAFMDNKKKRVFSFKYVGAEQPLGGGLELANHSKVGFCVSVVQFNQCLVKMMNLEILRLGMLINTQCFFL